MRRILCTRVRLRGRACNSKVRHVLTRARSTGQAAPLSAQRFGLTDDQMKSVLNDYWQRLCAALYQRASYNHCSSLQARGIHDTVERENLLQIATEHQPDLTTENTTAQQHNLSSSEVATGGTLPGVETVWALKTPEMETDAKLAVQHVSGRLLELSALLGVQHGEPSSSQGVDVAQMLLREPGLLTADLKEATRRLLELRIKLPRSQDLARLLMQQPSLLLADFSTLQDSTLEQLLPALQHGLSSDLPEAWSRNLNDLQSYTQMHGDSHCGYRDSDSPALSRWCRKQRADFKNEELTEAQISQLKALNFEFDGERAEWLRWYSELQDFVARSASSAASDWEIQTARKELYLTNWCAVQRIARRSGVMSQERIDLLDELGFEWSGADPLS